MNLRNGYVTLSRDVGQTLPSLDATFKVHLKDVIGESDAVQISLRDSSASNYDIVFSQSDSTFVMSVDR